MEVDRTGSSWLGRVRRRLLHDLPEGAAFCRDPDFRLPELIVFSTVGDGPCTSLCLLVLAYWRLFRLLVVVGQGVGW